MTRQSRASVVRVFGADFADRIEPLPVGRWHGPLDSVRGVHLIRPTERHPAQAATFQGVESYLRQDWIMTQTRALQQKRVDEIRSRYRIEMVEQ